MSNDIPQEDVQMTEREAPKPTQAETEVEMAEKADKKAPKKAMRFAEKVEELEKALAESQKKADQNWDKALRAVAELENTKRRAEKDVTNAHKYALERFVNALLPVVDSMEKALEVQSDHEEVAAMKQGVELTMKMFIDATTKFGLEQLDPMGETFDPEIHEAMSMVEVPDTEANTVITVYQKGYRLNGRLVRPARVVVAK